MIEIISFIIVFSIILIFAILNYKKCNNGGEKIIFTFYVIIISIPIILYYLDLWNIPSKLNLMKNIDTQNWLGFLFTYVSTIVSSVIGVTASIYIAFIQIRKNNEDNEKRDKENLRIQNMPLLKYNIDTERKCEGDISELIITSVKDGQPFELNFSFKNIGLNSVKNIIIDYESDVTNSTYRLSGKNNIISMEKGEEIESNHFISLKLNSTINMKLIMYYEDVLNNWYRQVVNIIYNASNVFEKGNYIGNVKYLVKNEEMIEESNINKDVI
jgi:hypothetical protein